VATDTPAAAVSTVPAPITEIPTTPATQPVEEEAMPDTPTTRESRLTPAQLVFPENVPNPAGTPVTGEVPEDMMAAILADAADRADLPPEAFTVVRAEAVIWNDGSLGCPQPGMMYTQALVDGYWVELQAEGKELDYRATQSGYFVLCERSPLVPIAPPGEGTDPTPEQ
jgi:hypothetical protein